MRGADVVTAAELGLSLVAGLGVVMAGVVAADGGMMAMAAVVTVMLVGRRRRRRGLAALAGGSRGGRGASDQGDGEGGDDGRQKTVDHEPCSDGFRGGCRRESVRSA